MTRRKLNPARQAGYTLIELMIVIAILGFASIYLAQRAKEAAEIQLANSAADNLTILGTAVTNYISDNTATLSGTAANQPLTIATLQTLGTCGTPACLNSTFGTPAWTGGYTINVRRLGGAAPYQFEALACTANAWIIATKLRGDLVGAAVKRIGGNGGMTWDTTSGALGSGGGWTATVASYPYANVAGELCYFVSQSVVGLDNLYLRTDGTNKMNAALQMNTNAIAGATTINANGLATLGSVSTGAVTAGAVNATGVTSSGNVTGVNVTGTTLVTGGTVTSNGNINMGSGSTLQSTGRINIQAGENLVLQPNTNAFGSPTIVGGGTGSGNLTVSNNATVGNTVAVTNDVTISTLTSRASPTSVTSLKALAPKLVEVDSVPLWSHGQGITVPPCASGGAPRIFSIPSLVRGQVQAGNWGADIHIAGPLGGPWTFYAADSAGTPLPATSAANPIAIARIFCTY